MHVNKILASLAITLLLAPTVLYAGTVSKIDSYGVYVIAKNGFQKIGPYKHYDTFVDYKFLKEIEHVVRSSEELKLVVYDKDFKDGNFTFELRPMQTIVDVQRVKFNVKPHGKPDMYELSLDKPVKDGTMLHVYAGSYYDNYMGAIMLGNTEEQLVKFFSNKSLDDPIVVSSYLDDALVAYPGNSKLKDLTSFWKGAAEKQKDLKDYSYVEEKWKKYQSTEKIKLKVRYLKQMQGEINAYLRDHPNGGKASEAKERQAFAKKEIEKLSKQI